MRHRHDGFYARLLSSAAFISLTAGGAAWAQDETNFNIPPQPLASALNAFGEQSQMAVLFTPELTATKISPGLIQTVDPETAMRRMLAGTGLSYRRNGDTFIVMRADQDPQGGGAGGSADGDVDALIVTAQKKEEAIQDVPIAISAFTQKSLDAQKIEGGFDLLKAIPNVTFSKSNFSGYNFSIRGIGTKAVSATTDPGVAVAFNNSTLIVNRLFEQEYFDVERVEVLRGPQGTLYGRNATGGVINVLSARPRLGEFEAEVKAETGNYDARRARGMVNIPIGDKLAIRAAGALTQRLGYGVNEAANDPNVLNDVREDVDGRDLWSARVTVGWEPIEQVRVNALWERFEEDDNRVRTSKQLCHHDAGPQTIGAFEWGVTRENSVLARAVLSQGCLPGSLYDDGAFGTPNGASLPYVSALYWPGKFSEGFRLNGYGLGGNPYYDPPGAATAVLPAPCDEQAEQRILYPLDVCAPDPYGNRRQSTDLRTIHSQIEPTYRAKADIFELNFEIDLTDSLSFTSQTVFVTDEYYASQDYNRFTTSPIFSDSLVACDYISATSTPVCPGTLYDGFYENLIPGGVFTDPQLGPSRSLVAQDLSQSTSEQFNQEFRLASNYDSDVNFSIGSNFTRFETLNDYYVFINAATLLTHFFPFNTPVPILTNLCTGGENLYGIVTPVSTECFYVDPNPLASINGEGHNYFRSANPYELTSSAIFGELYWQATETLKVTVGARMSWDRKVFTPIPSQLLLQDYRYGAPLGAGPEGCIDQIPCQIAGTGIGGRGSPAEPEIRQEWREPTGRLIVDWKPDLGFTDETMLYASVAHGYKGGGANPPKIGGPAGILAARSSGFAAAPATFEPEFIDAFELGTKNTLLGGGLVLNANVFYYNYTGYQVSKIVDRSAANENFDATVAGVEIEWIYSPTRNLRFNGTFGHLRTEIAEGEKSIDLMDRAAGGNTPFTFVTPGGETVTYDRWMVIKPWLSSTSNCVVPADFIEGYLSQGTTSTDNAVFNFWLLCPTGNPVGLGIGQGLFGLPPGLGVGATPTTGGSYTPATDAPNGGAGFSKELGGNDLPNAPHWTVSFGAQYRFSLPAGWEGTFRVDHYWQDESFARVYNTEYDRLQSWQNTNFSLWFDNPDWGVKAEVYVKNAFDEIPITDAFLNSDDSGLTTNVFTLDPRLIGVSVTKTF